MNITRTIAEEVAQKLTAQKQREIKEMKGRLGMAVTLAYESTIPKEVAILFDTHKDWMKKVSSVRLHGRGFNYETINLSKVLPSKKEEYSSQNMNVEKEYGDKWIKDHQLIEKAQKELKTLVAEIENALIGLKTYKRVEENFPEAAKFLPQKGNTAIAINLSHIRNQLTP